MPAPKPVGSKRINANGYVQIKTKMGQRRWPFEHRVVWETANGPLPVGHAIHHLNEIKTDNRLENLVACATNGDHHHLFHRGTKRPNAGGKGKPKTPEHRAKIAAAHKGKQKSEAHRRALSKSLSGKRLKPELRAAITAGTRTPEYRQFRSELSKKLIKNRQRDPLTGRIL